MLRIGGDFREILVPCGPCFSLDYLIFPGIDGIMYENKKKYSYYYTLIISSPRSIKICERIKIKIIVLSLPDLNCVIFLIWRKCCSGIVKVKVANESCCVA